MNDRVFVCACTHYLVFKEPTYRSTLDASPILRLASTIFQSPPPVSISAAPGELTEITIAAFACQPLFASFSNFLFEAVCVSPCSAACLSSVRKCRRTNLAVSLRAAPPRRPQQTLCCRRRPHFSAALGELIDITIAAFACQPPFCFSSNFSSEKLQMSHSAIAANLPASGKCRLNEPGSISGDKLKACCLAFSSLSAAQQRVSHAECLESMAYKNWAVNPHKTTFFRSTPRFSPGGSALRPCGAPRPPRRSPSRCEFWPEYRRSVCC